MANGIEAGKAYVKFLLDGKDLKKGLAQVGAKLQSIGKIGMAATAPIVAGFAAATKSFMDAGDELAKMRDRTGISVEALSDLKYAADQSGTSLAGMDKAVKKMQVGILDATKGTGGLYESLGALGVNLETLRESTPEEQFLTLARAIARVQDPTMRAALAQKAFGRSGTELLPILAQGEEGMLALFERNKELGLQMSGETADAAVSLGDNLADLQKQVTAMAIQVGAAIAGPLTEFAKSLQPILAHVIELIRANPELVKTVAEVTLALGAASIATYGLGVAMSVASKAPLVLVLAGIALAVWDIVAAYQAWDKWITKVIDDASGGIPWAPGSGPDMAPASSGRSVYGLNMTSVNADADRLIAESNALASSVEAGMSDLAASLPGPSAAPSVADASMFGGSAIEYLKEIATSNEGILAAVQRKSGLLAGAS